MTGLNGSMVAPEVPGYDSLIGAIREAIRLASELNTGWHTPDEVRGCPSRITGHEADGGVTRRSPSYADCGINIRTGKRCRILQGGTHLDRGGITL